MKRVHFNSHGCNLNGYLFVPDNWLSPQRFPCVLVVPGGHGLINRIKTHVVERVDEEGKKKTTEVPISSAIDGLLDLSRSLQHSGFAVLAYDGRGMGGEHSQLPRSEGERKEQKVSQEDVKAALDYLQTVDCIDSNRIGAFGQSVGGAAIAYQAIEDDRLKSLVLWGTPPSYTECVADKRLNLTRTGLDPNSKLLDIYEIISAIRQPVLLAGGSEDRDYFRPEDQQRNFDGLKSSSIVSMLVVKGFEHRIDACYPSFPTLVRLLAGWFTATL
jgi:dienelactone hydrolase